MGLVLPIGVTPADDGTWHGYSKPGPTNTGPYDEDILVDIGSGSFQITVDGTIMENFTAQGAVWVRANNVTVRNFRIDGNSPPDTPGGTTYPIVVDGGLTGVVIEDGDVIGADSAGIKGGPATFRRLQIHESNSDGAKPSSGSLIESCWMYNLGRNTSAHADCVQMKGGDGVTIRANFLNIPVPQPPPYASNACGIFDNENAPMTNTTIEYNWLDGGQNVIYHNLWVPDSGHAMSGLQVLHNRFTRDHAGVPLASTTTDNIVLGNYWDDNDEYMDINDDYVP